MTPNTAPSGRARRAGVAAAAAFALAALGACGTLTSDAPRFDFYVIEDLRPAASAPAPTAPPRVDRTLLLTTGAAQALFDSDRIVFTRDGIGRAYYQYSNWSERPARRIVSLAEARLAQGGGFRAVAQTVAGVRGEQVLSLRLEELVHDDSMSPGVLRLTVIAELLDWRTRTMAARRTFTRVATVGSRDAKGAARAASVAVTELLDEIATWTEASVAAIPAGPAGPAMSAVGGPAGASAGAGAAPIGSPGAAPASVVAPGIRRP